MAPRAALITQGQAAPARNPLRRAAVGSFIPLGHSAPRSALRARSTPGRIAGAAMNNVGLAAHRLVTACPTASPNNSPMSREHDPPGGAGRIFMPDNGSAYRSTIHPLACRTLGIKHLRTRPNRPRTNGKAERFIRTLLGLGLRSHLPKLHRAGSHAIRLARLLQSPPTTRLPRPPSAHRPPHRPTDGSEKPGRLVQTGKGHAPSIL